MSIPGRRLLASVSLLVATAACEGAQMGCPRTPMSASSPDGRWIAFARNHPNPDPPSQTIWLQPANGSPVKLRALAPDAEWISAIVWSGDSRRVAFLTMDATLDVHDAATRTSVFLGSIRWPNRDYPPARMVRALEVSADGEALSFVPCERSYTPVAGTRSRMQKHIECSDKRETVLLRDLIKREGGRNAAGHR